MKKRLTAILLCALFLLGIFCSCANNTSIGAGTDDEKYSVTSSETSRKYAELLKNRANGKLSGNYVIGDETDAQEYDVSLGAFAEDGYIIRRMDNDTLIFGKTDKGLDRAVRYFTNYCLDSTGDLSLIYGEGPKVKELTIAGNDISEYKIYLFKNADECHTFAAEMLRDYIGRACGIYPEIVREKPSGHMISFVQDKSGKHGDEAFTIAVNDGNLTITGGQYRGCLYGVCEFLESYVGWRFLYDLDFTWGNILHPYYESAADSIIDYLYEADHVDVPEGTKDYQTPSFSLRQPNYQTGLIKGGNYQLKRKANGIGLWSSFGYPHSKFNAYGMSVVANHGVQALMINQLIEQFGVDPRVQQPCYTDENIIKLADEVFSAEVERRLANGDRIGLELTNIDVAIGDNNEFCTCKGCREYIKLDKAGSTGPVLYFTNRLADIYAKKYPGLKVSMLAYLDVKRPPAVTVPRENVQVSYCFYFNGEGNAICSAHGISGENCKKGSLSNIRDGEYIKKWCEITDDILIWYYPGTWYCTSMNGSYIYTLLEDMRFLSSLESIIGIYNCANYSRYGDGIVSYLSTRLMWDSDVTDKEYEEMIKEYCTIMYGSGGKYIYEFMHFKEKANQDKCWSNMLFSSPTSRIKFDMYAENADYIVSLFDNAAKYADTELQAVRCETLSMNSYFIIAVGSYDDEYVNGTKAQKDKYTSRWNTFLDNVKKYGFDFGMDYIDTVIPEFPFDQADLSVNPGSLFPIARHDQWWVKR